MSENKYTSKLLSALKWNGEYLEDAEGVSHSSGSEYMSHLLGFCGCGCPEAALSYVRSALLGIKRVKDCAYSGEAFASLRDQYRDDGERYFLWYRLDDLRLTEHGGAVPGWLTPKGVEWLDALNELHAEAYFTPPP